MQASVPLCQFVERNAEHVARETKSAHLPADVTTWTRRPNVREIGPTAAA